MYVEKIELYVCDNTIIVFGIYHSDIKIECNCENTSSLVYSHRMCIHQHY